MTIDRVRQYCLSLAHTTEQVQWGIDLVFKVGGKMYAVLPLEPAPVWLSLRSTPEESAELVERAGIIPAPYLARVHWISLQTPAALPPAEIERLLRQAHDLTFAKLPKKTQTALNQKSQAPQTGSGRRKRGASGARKPRS